MESANIIVVDQQADWRNFARATLRDMGYSVTAVSDYDRLRTHHFDENHRPALVVLGCAGIGVTESDLIGHMHGLGIKTVVFSTSVPPRFMRMLFLRGASDVVDKTYSRNDLRSVVRNVIGRPLRRDVSHHYMALMREP